MKNYQDLVSNELVNDILDDDIDELYCQLEQIEPPTFLVDSIMASVAHLPQVREQVKLEEDSRTLASPLNDISDFLMRGLGIQLS
ncbi:hypothetical protein KSF_025270 [Reticulibacter mediterranei]|uniref:Uncharacterized protein n=1 Tax=Reticulibacter mediterranei TaxID=2778369 RepID=A0A8J3IJB8_9CHLR|nr:hypothetical protein [Reticulibacter mediterranei]GHO92479.1 hypothetical protein KSF_025270 [Reticulibacter mediterranei]